MTYYYVCDTCGSLANVTDAPLPDDGSWVCDMCESAALWEFTDANKALNHAEMILGRNRDVGAR